MNTPATPEDFLVAIGIAIVMIAIPICVVQITFWLRRRKRYKEVTSSWDRFK